MRDRRARVVSVVSFSSFVWVAAVQGCGHQIDSPGDTAGPVPSAVNPDLVCVEQLTTSVTLHGDGFTPMPSKTLEKPVELLLPKIDLLADQTLTGGAAPKHDYAIPDDPTKPAASVVHWSSPQQMEFKVSPALSLSPGLYDIKVTNPDGSHAATFSKALAGVPAPSVTKLNEMAICDQESDQTLQITGTAFLEVGTTLPTVTVGDHMFTATKADGCAAVPGMHSEGSVQLCTSITFVIPQGTFAPGDYKLTVTNPPPANCVSTQAINLHVEPPPAVSSVKPAVICSGGGILTIDGSGFIATPTVSLQAQGQTTLTGTGSTLSASGTEVSATFGPGAVVGATYDVVVANPDGCTDLPLPHKTVTAIQGPIVYDVDPFVVFNGVPFAVTVYTTGITPPITAVTIAPTGTTTPVTNLSWNPVTGHPNRLQATISKGQAAGVYDLTVTDSSGCLAIFPKALTVTQTETLSVKNIVPPFGWTSSITPVTIYRDTAAAAPANKPFVATPRAYFYPHAAVATDVAATLDAVSFVDQNTVTAVVPSGLGAKAYDLIVTNPNGDVGYLANAFTVTSSAPPTVTTVTPSSIVAATGQSVVVSGTNFTSSTVSISSCVNATGTSVTAPSVTSGTASCTGGTCTQTATIDGSTLTAGDVCILRVKNTDGSYFDYSAIGVTTPSLNLNAPSAGPTMVVYRRALVSSAGDATSAARFVYAIGGDPGAAMASAPLDSTEFAPVDLYGSIKAWQKQQYKLPSGRSFSGVAKYGRYTYVIGGSDGTNAVATVWRGMILSPLEAPGLDLNDIQLADTGLDAGFWYYKVSAIFSSTDPDNPGGQSLPSAEMAVRLPAITGKKLRPVLQWSAPVDGLGQALPNVVGYNIYRTAMADAAAGSEALLASVGNVMTFTDDGSKTVTAGSVPLPVGSMGEWAALASMSTPRKGPAGAIAFDPSNASKFYVYALLGLNGTTAERSYEFLDVTVQGNGHQTAGTAWTAGANQSAQGRWQIQAWAADSSVSSSITSGTYVYIGGGLDASGTAANDVEVGHVAAGGDLGTIALSNKTFNMNLAGYGSAAANEQLFTFGGAQAAPSRDIKAASITTPLPDLANGAWNNNGAMMVQSRYLLGSSIQSAFIFLVGGDTGGGNASNTTEALVW